MLSWLLLLFRQFYFLIDFSLVLTLQVNLGMYVTDGKYELSVLVDRAVGASSIQDGQIEMMFHRYYSFYCSTIFVLFARIDRSNSSWFLYLTMVPLS